MYFGEALEAAADGQKIARAGWNGKGMFVYYVEGQTVLADVLRGAAFRHIGSQVNYDTPIRINGHLDMKAADGSIVVGWTPSQLDLQGSDWEVV